MIDKIRPGAQLLVVVSLRRKHVCSPISVLITNHFFPRRRPTRRPRPPRSPAVVDPRASRVGSNNGRHHGLLARDGRFIMDKTLRHD